MSGTGEVCLQVVFIVWIGLHQQDNCCKKYNMKAVLGLESLYVWGATFCHVPVLLPVNCWILVFVIPVCCHHAEAPGGVCRSSVITVRTSIYVVVWGIHVCLVHWLTPLLFLSSLSEVIISGKKKKREREKERACMQNQQQRLKWFALL